MTAAPGFSPLAMSYSINCLGGGCLTERGLITGHSWSNILWWRLCLASDLLQSSFLLIVRDGGCLILNLRGLITKHSWSSILWWQLWLASDLLKCILCVNINCYKCTCYWFYEICVNFIQDKVILKILQQCCSCHLI